jgi:heptosyltransferase-1
VLIVKMSSLGDVVHALPVASALRRSYPHMRISWAVEDWAAPLLVGHPAIDRLIVFPRMAGKEVSRAWLRSLANAVRELQSEPYDVSLDLQGLLKSSVVVLLSRARVRIGTHGQREGASFVSRAVPGDHGQIHVVDDYLRCAEFLGASASPVSFDLRVQPEAEAAVVRLLAEVHVPTQPPLIVINPSCSTAWRTWPAERWVPVVSALAADGAVVLIGSHKQVTRHAQIARAAWPRPHDLTGRTTLPELVALLGRCALHIAPDTGTAHIAAALGRPVVGLYGPTAPWRKAPYGNEDLAVYHPGACGPSCPRLCLRRRRCLQAATPEEIVHQARRAVARVPYDPRRVSANPSTAAAKGAKNASVHLS